MASAQLIIVMQQQHTVSSCCHAPVLRPLLDSSVSAVSVLPVTVSSLPAAASAVPAAAARRQFPSYKQTCDRLKMQLQQLRGS